MTDRAIDPERPREANAFDRPDSYSGQGYTAEREQVEGRRADEQRTAEDGRDLPLDAGRPAGANRISGEVHGSGSGIGGGNAGEDYDSSSASGDSAPVTGGEGSNHLPSDLGLKRGS